MTELRNNIIHLLTEDARLSVSEISKITGKKADEVANEIKALEDSGVICKYTVVINDERAGKEDVEALIEVKVSPMHKHGFDAIAEEIYRFDEVKTVYLMSGAYDLCVVIEGRTLKEVARFVSEKLSVMDKVLSTATHFILKKYKVNGILMQKEDGWNNRQAVHP